MSPLQPTDAQRLAIESPYARTLVSASAGTGKTHVLVGRYLRLVQQGAEPSRILAVTFTEAAASEMRARIRQGIGDWARASGEEARWSRSLAALDAAPISTIHSFCRSLLAQEYHALGIDPAFEMLDAEEAAVLKRDTVARALEESYADTTSRGGAFRSLVRRIADKNLDERLAAFVVKTSDFLDSLPDPEAWLDEKGAPYREAASAEMKGPALEALVRAVATAFLATAVERFAAGAELASAVPALRDWQEDLSARAKIYAAVANRLEGGAPLEECTVPTRPHLSRARPGVATSQERDPIRQASKEGEDEVARAVPLTTREGLRAHVLRIRNAAPDLDVLLDLIGRFRAAYREAKDRRSVLDFSDLEHHALGVLRRRGEQAHEGSDFDHVLVDEYQDVNRVQDEILERVAGGEGASALFLVGDIKQSIFRFRQAEPTLFLSRLAAHGPDAPGGRFLVPLAENHRSKQAVLDAVNAIFTPLMSPSRGGVRYDAEHALVEGSGPDGRKRDWPGAPDVPAVEILLIEPPDAASEDAGGLGDWLKIEREARCIAARLAELLPGGSASAEILDPETGERGPLAARHVAVLLRTMKGRSHHLEYVLRESGIPAVASRSGGYFDALEIRRTLALLTCVQNPLDDIPLAASLRLPVFGFSLDELAQARAFTPSAPLYTAIRNAARLGGTAGERAARAISRLDRWRTEARLRALPDLLSLLYEETCLPAFVLGFPDGEVRRSNLLRFFEIARRFHRSGWRPLAEFLAYLSRLEEADLSLAPPSAEGSAVNAVKIQSIHEAKGLEFPVVVVADLAHEFNLRDRDEPVPVAREAGLGLRWFDESRRIAMPTLVWDAVRDEIEGESCSEEMRLLYVALTRARERLILSASPRWKPFLVCCRAAAQSKDGSVPRHLVNRAKSFIEWIGPAVALQPDGAALGEEAPGETAAADRPRLFDVRIEKVGRGPSHRRARVPDARLAAIAARQPLDPPPVSDPKVEAMVERAAWVPSAGDARRPAKASVSELKRPLDRVPAPDPIDEARDVAPAGSSDVFRRRPSFTEAVAPDAIARGRAAHALLQRIDLAAPADEATIRRTLEDLIGRELLEPWARDAVDAASIARFLSSELGRRLTRDPARVRREFPVNLAVAPDVWEKWSAGEWAPAERTGGAFVHVQGIIDCLVEEDEGILLVDYKTDRMEGAALDARAAAYRPQLLAYAAAVRALLGREVKEAALYFLHAGETRRIALP